MKQPYRTVDRHRAAPRVCAALIACAVFWSASPARAQSSADDVQSFGNRAQTAFLRGDASALSRIESGTRAWRSAKDPMKLYGYAFVKFRVMLQAREARDEDRVEAAGAACVEALDAALELSGRFADAYALRGTCHAYLASLSMINWFLHRSDAADDAELSLRLAPGNPRATNVEALLLWFGPVFYGDQPAACKLFQRVADAYGDQPGADVTRDRAGIRWGAPEAYLQMGRCARLTEDREAEYQYYDRALRFAPDYAAVKSIVR